MIVTIRLFGIITAIAGFITLILALRTMSDLSELTENFALSCSVIAGILLILAGLFTTTDKKGSKTKAIGRYAFALGLGNALIAFTNLQIETDYTVLLTQLIYLIIGLSFMWTGISYLCRKVTNILRTIAINCLLLLVTLSGFITLYELGEGYNTMIELIQIIILTLFLALLLSKEVRQGIDSKTQCENLEQI